MYRHLGTRGGKSWTRAAADFPHLHVPDRTILSQCVAFARGRPDSR
jgi:hypothetical protein